MENLKNKDIEFKKEINKKLISYYLLLCLTLIFSSVLITMCWLYADMGSSILITVLMSLVSIAAGYFSLVEIIYKHKLKSLFIKKDYLKIIQLSNKFYNLPNFKGSKDDKLINLAIFSCKADADSEDKFLQCYKNIKNDSLKNTALAFYHILFLIRHECYERAVNEYLGFKLHAGESYLYEVQLKMIELVLNYIKTGDKGEQFNQLEKYIESEYLDTVINEIKHVRDIELPF